MHHKHSAVNFGQYHYGCVPNLTNMMRPPNRFLYDDLLESLPTVIPVDSTCNLSHLVMMR